MEVKVSKDKQKDFQNPMYRKGCTDTLKLIQYISGIPDPRTGRQMEMIDVFIVATETINKASEIALI